MDPAASGPFSLLEWRRSAAEPPRWAGSRRALAPDAVACVWSSGYLVGGRAEGSAAEGPGPSDRDRVAALYRRHGLEAAERLAGPLAWIVWDGPRRRLVAVRDRLGLEGLFYALDGDVLLLAGRVVDLKRRLGGATLDPVSAVAQIQVRAPLAGATFYSEIRAVAAGGWLVAEPAAMREGRYWSLAPGRLEAARDAAAAPSELLETLTRIAAEHAPPGGTGITLSGGLDSTALAAALVRSGSTRPTAISWIAPELPAADESAEIRAVCERLDLELATVRADLSWPLSTAVGLATAEDSPFRNYYDEIWDATYAAAAARGVATLYSGASGDLVFGGGGWMVYPDLLLAGRWPELLRQMEAERRISGRGFARVARLSLLRPLARALLPRWRPASWNAAPWLRRRHHETWRELRVTELPPRSLPPGRGERLSRLKGRWIGQVLERENRRARARGVELRHPLMDHRLFERAAALPAESLFRDGRSKWIVREAMRGILPARVLERARKVTPIAIADRGLKERETGKVRALTTGMRAAELGLVDERRLRLAYERYLGGRGDTRFWHTLALEDWLRRYF